MQIFSSIRNAALMISEQGKMLLMILSVLPADFQISNFYPGALEVLMPRKAY